MVKEWWMLIFPTVFWGFRTHVVATTVCTTWVYIHSLVARTFFCTWRVHNHIHTSHACHIHAWLKAEGCQKGVCICVTFLSISSSPFSDFIRLPCCSLTVTSRPLPTATPLTTPCTWSCRTFSSSKHRTCATTCIAKFGYLATSDANTGYGPNEFDKITSVDGNTMLINGSDDNEQETSEMKSEEFAFKTDVLAFASRSKAKAKPRRRTSACSSTRTVPICARSWTDVEPGTYSHLAYPVSKRLSTLLRHGDLPREEDGAIEFWRLKDCLRYEFENSRQWSGENVEE